MLKILIVDAANDRLLFKLLKRNDYELITTFSGEECLKLCSLENPDIVLMDISILRNNDFELLKNINEFNPAVKVIIIATPEDMDIAMKAFDYQISDLIFTPINEKILSFSINKIYEQIILDKKVKEHTNDLESMVNIAIDEVSRKSDFQQKLIYSSNEGIVATNEFGNIITYNLEAERIFGYSRNSVIRKMDITDLFPDEVAEQLWIGSELKRARVGHLGKPSKEVNILSRDGEKVPTLFTGTILYEKEDVIGSVAFFQDLREIKRLEKELLRSERLAIMGQTIAGLAHYIKNILAGLKGGSYVANIGFEKNNIEKLGSGWTIVQKNIKRIGDLVQELLTYSKEREPEYKNGNINEITSDVCDLMEPKAIENNIELTRNLDMSIGEAAMDSQLIHRSILNLVTNAIDACIFDDFIKDKYYVDVRTVLENNEVIVLEVKDNGCGISKNSKSDIFAAFYSTKMGKGTGLGLLVTKKLVEEHNGSIDFVSQPGKGSTFTIRLPLKVMTLR